MGALTTAFFAGAPATPATRPRFGIGGAARTRLRAVGVKGDDVGEYFAGDRANAKFHADNQWYPGIILYKKDEGVWDISWDEPDESEQITSVTQVKLLKRGKGGMEDIPNVPLKKGD